MFFYPPFLIPFLGLACQPEDIDSTSFSWTTPSPEWDAQALEERTIQALQQQFPSALSLRNHYVEILQYRNDNCPSLLASDAIIGSALLLGSVSSSL